MKLFEIAGDLEQVTFLSLTYPLKLGDNHKGYDYGMVERVS